jgi:deoxycytidine triphosphate deaminase
VKHIAGSKSRSTLTPKIDVSDIQANAVDLRVARILRIPESTFKLSNEDKKHRGSKEIPTLTDSSHQDTGWWHLMPGAYEVVFEPIVCMGAKEVGWLVQRSTLARNGIFIVGGLYDSGYHGSIGACMHVTTGPFEVKRGTRLAQFVLFDAEQAKLYDGSYGIAADGTIKAEEAKYLKGN